MTRKNNPRDLATRWVRRTSAEGPKFWLEDTCRLMNGPLRSTERVKEFIRLVERWQRAESLHEMLREDPTLRYRLACEATVFDFYGSETSKHGAYDVRPVKPIEFDRYPDSWAIAMFANLVINPLCEKFAGPCAECGRYFLRGRSDQDKYCSSTCGGRHTAKKQQKEKQEERMRRARELIRKWNSLRTRPEIDWKDWAKEQDADISKNWLTRAVNEYGLKPPTKGSNHVKGEK